MQVAILGCGHVSEQYFFGCRQQDALELVACADLDLNRAEQKAAEHSVPRACSPEELIADPEVELVVNLTPPLAHADVSLAALRAGKHVWSEKPLAATLERAGELVAAAEETGLRLGCAPDTFLGGGLQTSMKLVDDGWIGRPIAGAICVSESGYEDFHPDVSAFYGPGGGPALDLGPYYVTAIVAMLGPVARVTGFARTTFPERTFQIGPRQGQPISVQVPTHVTGVLELASGALVTTLMSWDIESTQLPYLEIYGTAGSLSSGNPDLFDSVPHVRRAAEPSWMPFPLIQPGDVGRGIGIADMAEAIRDGRPHRASAELAFHVLEVLLALEAGGRVDIDSRCERPR
jgi:predicted dehydrogenase